MNRNIILFFKGIIIGIGKIIPGVSGSLIAFNLGLYEKIIYSICNFFNDFKNNFLFLGILSSGILFSIIMGSYVVSYFLNKYYFITMLFFVGLIFGSLLGFYRQTKLKTIKEFGIFIITFIIMIYFSFFKSNNVYVFHSTICDYIYMFILGFIDAFTMIIPGISGTAIFILLGVYNYYLDIFKSMHSLNSIVDNFIVLLLFGLGLIVGIIIVSKLMNYLLNKKKEIIYPIILSLSMSSIFILLIKTFEERINSSSLFIGLIFLIFGLKIGKLLNK